MERYQQRHAEHGTKSDSFLRILQRIVRIGEHDAELDEALKVDGPAIVDCVVAADEMPNFPHLELDKIGNYAIAKIKEAVLAVTGR